MRRIITVFVLLGLVSVGCTADSDPPEPAADRAGTGQCEDSLDEAFGAWQRAGFSGVVAVSTGDRFDCLAGYGYADEADGTPNSPETVFSIGSITKTVTAAGILDLADNGALSLTDRAGDLLPELSGPVADATVMQLLLHTSGLTGTFGQDYEPMTEPEAIEAIDGLEIAFPPGTDFLYSNAGYTLLALIMQRVTDAGYRDHLASTVLTRPDGAAIGGFWNGEPAAPGPRAVGYLGNGETGERGDFPGPHWALNGNGGIAMTAGELAEWVRALFTGGVVSPQSVDLITTPQLTVEPGVSETPGWAMYDESVLGVAAFATAGGGGQVGHNAVAVWVPEPERVVVMMSNRPDPSAESLLEAVAGQLLAGEPLPTPAAPAEHADPAAIVGTYQLDTGGSFEVQFSDGQVRITATGADAVAVLFPAGGRFTTEDISDHEDHVQSLLAGQSREGRTERELLEESFGAITGVELAGTVVREGELRTYVTVRSATGSVLGWYAVDRHGGIAAAEVPSDPPSLPLVPAGGDRYRPDGPAGSGPELTIESRDDGLAVIGPSGTTLATRSG